MAELLKAVIDVDVRKAEANVISFGKTFTGQFDKINQSANNLSADITASINKINASLASLKVTSVDISVDTSAIDASVKDIQAKFANLINPEINVLANTEQAELEVKELLGQLSTLKGSEIFIRANDTQALAAINLIETELKSLLDKQINLNINTADLAQAKDALNSLIGKNIKVDVDATAALQKVGTLRTQLATISNVPFKFDASNAIASISNLQSKVQGLQNSLKTSTGLNSFYAALNKTTAAAGALAAKSAGLNNFFGKIQSSSKQAANGLNNLKGAGNEASQTLLNFGRVAQDAPFGILGIANNLNPLVESFQRASVAAKATGTSLTKNLLGALKGGGGIGLAISVVSSLLIVFGDKLFGAGKKAKDAAKDIEESNEQIKGLANSVAQSITKFTLLTGVIKNVNTSYGDKAKALAAINSEYKDYLDSLGIEKVTVENLDAAYNKLIDTLLRQAVVKGIQEQVAKEVSKIAEEIIKLNLPLEKTRAEAETTVDALLTLGKVPPIKPVVDTPKFIGGLRQLKIATTDGAIAAQQFRTEVVKTQGDLNNFADVEKRTAKITAQLKEELKKALGPLLFLAKGFDDLDIKVPELKNTDDTLERARQFVKDFGDIFVLPDLSETFFRGKKELLPIARKLLDDVAKGNLQIKIPVFTDFEFLPTETPLSKEQLDELTKGFFKGIAAERGIPIDIVFDPSLNVDNTKLINSKVELKKTFEDTFGKIGIKAFGEINFDNLKEGVIEANALFLEMKANLLATADLVTGVLAPAFGSMFDAIIDGEKPLKAFFKGLTDSVNQLIKRLIAAAIQAAVLSALSGGATSFGSAFSKLLGFAGGGRANFGLGGAIGSRSFQNTLQVVVTGQISGSTINLAGQRAAISNQRGG